jgi:hypothetical protein
METGTFPFVTPTCPQNALPAWFIRFSPGLQVSSNNGEHTTNNGRVLASFASDAAIVFLAETLSAMGLTTICDEELLGSFVKFPWACTASLAVYSVAVAGSFVPRASMPWSLFASMATAQLTSISGSTALGSFVTFSDTSPAAFYVECGFWSRQPLARA